MNTKLHQLEGLRGVAAVVVLLYHLRLTFFVDANTVIAACLGSTAATFFEALFDGDFAVWLFWVMSAFVLSLRFCTSIDHAEGNLILTDATLRRYPRLLLPVIASVVFAWVLHKLGLMSNVKLANLLGADYNDWLGSFYLFEPNVIEALRSGLWQSFFDYDASRSYNRVLWTMEIELYGSFFLFAYLALVGKHPSRVLIYFVTVVVVYKLSIHWINAFVLGALICDSFVNRDVILKFIPVLMRRNLNRLVQSPWAAVLSILPILYLIGLPNRGGVLHLLVASLLTSYVVISTPAGYFFSHRIPAFLGKISFGLYLAHLPIICTTAYPVYTALLRFLSPICASFVSSLFLIVFSLAAGWVLWFIADRPAIAFAKEVAKFLNNRFTTQCTQVPKEEVK